MHVTGFVKDRYFRIEALKGFALLPGYSFSLKPVKGDATEITAYVQLTCGNEKDPRRLAPYLYPIGGANFWQLYVSLLEASIMGKEKKAKLFVK